MTQTQRDILADIDESQTLRYCAKIEHRSDRVYYIGCNDATTDDAAMYLAIQAIHRDLGYNW